MSGSTATDATFEYLEAGIPEIPASWRECSSGPRSVLYVSHTASGLLAAGNDANPGTWSEPLNSIPQAIEYAELLKCVTIKLDSGDGAWTGDTDLGVAMPAYTADCDADTDACLIIEPIDQSIPWEWDATGGTADGTADIFSCDGNNTGWLVGQNGRIIGENQDLVDAHGITSTPASGCNIYVQNMYLELETSAGTANNVLTSHENSIVIAYNVEAVGPAAATLNHVTNAVGQSTLIIMNSDIRLRSTQDLEVAIACDHSAECFSYGNSISNSSAAARTVGIHGVSDDDAGSAGSGVTITSVYSTIDVSGNATSRLVQMEATSICTACTTTWYGFNNTYIGNGAANGAGLITYGVTASGNAVLWYDYESRHEQIYYYIWENSISVGSVVYTVDGAVDDQNGLTRINGEAKGTQRLLRNYTGTNGYAERNWSVFDTLKGGNFVDICGELGGTSNEGGTNCADGAELPLGACHEERGCATGAAKGFTVNVPSGLPGGGIPFIMPNNVLITAFSGGGVGQRIGAP